MTIQLIELYDASPLGYIKVRLFQESSSNSVPGFRAWASNSRVTRTTGCTVRNGVRGVSTAEFSHEGKHVRCSCGSGVSAAGVLPHNLSKLPILMPKIKDWHSRLRVHTLRLGLNGETDSSYRVSVFLLNSIFLLFRRVFLGSTIHSKEESMNEYVAGGFPFGKDMSVNP